MTNPRQPHFRRCRNGYRNSMLRIRTGSRWSICCRCMQVPNSWEKRWRCLTLSGIRRLTRSATDRHTTACTFPTMSVQSIPISSAWMSIRWLSAKPESSAPICIGCATSTSLPKPAAKPAETCGSLPRRPAWRTLTREKAPIVFATPWRISVGRTTLRSPSARKRSFTAAITAAGGDTIRICSTRTANAPKRTTL